MTYRHLVFFALTGLMLTLTGCQDQPAEQQAAAPKPKATPPAAFEQIAEPLKPPLLESFDTAAVKLPLFPQIGTYRPAEGSPEYASWQDCRNQLRGKAGIIPAGDDGNQAFSLSSVKGFETVGYFSPVPVEPNRTYHLKAKLKADLPKDAIAGIDIQEYKEFRWASEQFQADSKELESNIRKGFRLHGKTNDWRNIDYYFKTSKATKMIHLALFKQGPYDDRPVLFDDIAVERIE